jgi:hypothetical protein
MQVGWGEVGIPSYKGIGSMTEQSGDGISGAVYGTRKSPSAHSDTELQYASLRGGCALRASSLPTLLRDTGTTVLSRFPNVSAHGLS